MSQVDELLKLKQYDIYNNADLKSENLCELARLFSEEDIDLKEYFSLLKFNSKFCWINIIYIITYIEYPKKMGGIPILFELLMDQNWPVFKDAVKALKSFGKELILPYVEQYLYQAYREEDEMWISGIHQLVIEMGIIQNDFQNKDVYDLFQYGDDADGE